MSFKFMVTPIVLCASISAAFASDSTSYQYLMSHGMRVDGMIPTQIMLSNHQRKTIRLMNITLSPVTSKKMAASLSHILKNPTQLGFLRASDLPASNYLGMNGVPVLDQGQWGTCATFSTTASVDAIFPLLDESQVSQLCNLELGVTLDSGGQGGWQGSFGYVVLGQMSQYGYINKKYQHENGCGGLKNYPVASYDNGSAMTIDDFSKYSNMNFTKNDWVPIDKFDGNFSPLDPAAAEKALASVKNALNQGYRVVFGSLIDPNVGRVGAAGTYKDIPNVAWVMTPQMQQDIASNQNMEGHEIIIDGYDDNACATYTDTTGETQKQCGLLRIRNSWGPLAGDQGDFYMSYDHFKGMVIEAYAVGNDVKDKFKPA